MAKKNDNDQNYDLSMIAPGPVTVEGKITHLGDKAIMINRRRAGSSKREVMSIPRSALIFVKGTLEEGSVVTLIYLDDKAPAARKMTKVRVEGSDKKTGFISGQSEDGTSILINPEYARLVTSKDTEVEAPDTEVKKKSTKKKSSKDK